MILKSLEATNFQKYRKLSLTNLPARGVVGIVGGNESGKSTIGEAISFALFGRTVRTDDTNIKETIHWHEDAAQVKLAFSLGPKGEFEVTRDIDREGSYYAQLTDTATGKVVAKGVGKVQRRLDALLDISFEEFRYSFYLGQKELDVLRAVEGAGKRRALDQMIGLADLEAARERAHRELTLMRGELDRIQLETEHNRSRLAEYAGVPEGEEPVNARLREVDEKIDRLRAQEKEIARCAAEIAKKQQARHGAMAALDALRIRKYADSLGVLRDRTSSSAAALARQEEGALKELTEATAKDDARRDLKTRLEELERLVGLHADELQRDLKNTLEGSFLAAQMDLLTPQSRAEQLAVTQQRLDKTVVDLEAARLAARSAFWGGVSVFVAATVGFVLSIGGRAMFHPIAFLTVMGFTSYLMNVARLRSDQAAELDDRRQTFARVRASLEEEVSRKRRALDACMAFNKTDLAIIPEKVRWMDSERIAAFFDTIRRDHPVALGGASGGPGTLPSAEALAAIIEKKRQAYEQIRRQRLEMEEFLSWLRVTTTGLAASPHYPGDLGEGFVDTASRALPRPPALPIAYEGFRRAKERAHDLVGDCARCLFTMESAAHVPAPGDELSALGHHLKDALGEGGAIEAIMVEAQAVHDGGVDALDDLLVRARKLVQTAAAALPAAAALDEDAIRTAGRTQAQAQALAEATMERQSVQAHRSVLTPDVERHRILRETADELARKATEVSRRIKVRESLVEMLDELKDQLRARMGPSLGEFIAWVVPQLTHGRYTQVRISPELDVEVYSLDRGAFVNLASLSGGTIDQLFLAIRLAFSKALIYSKWSHTDQQYLFFDEPMAHFDASRGDAFLTLLNKRDSNFSQIFLTSQNGAIERQCDRIVHTSVTSADLADA